MKPSPVVKPVVIPATPDLTPNDTFARSGADVLDVTTTFTPSNVELRTGKVTATIGVTNADGSVAQVDPVDGVIVQSGSRITITLKGYKFGDIIDVILHSRPITLGRVRIIGDGTGKGTFLVPKGIEAGHHTVQIVQVANPGNQTILALGVTSKSNPEVTPTTTTTVAPTNTTGDSNNGGSSALLASLTALLVIAAGAWFVIGRRKCDDVDPA